MSRFDRSAYSYRTDNRIPDFPDDRPIIVFDGVCVLCSGWVNFILRHDENARYRLLLAQSELGHALYDHYGLRSMDFETNLLIEDGCAYEKSEGSIRMAEGLGRPWSAAAMFRFLPLSVRDWLYEVIARNRFSLFGRLEKCYVPTTRFAERFIGGPLQ